MKIQSVDRKGIRQSWDLVFEASEVNAEYQKALENVAKNAKIQGFRPGKAPAKIVEGRYADEVQYETLRALRQEAIQALLKDKEIKIFSFASIEVPAYKSGESLTFKIAADLKPEFELPDFAKIELPKIDSEVKDEEVQGMFDSIIAQKATFNLVDHEAKKGDSVKISYVGALPDGTPMSKKFPSQKVWCEQKGTWETAGVPSPYGIAEIVDALIGMKKGDKKEVSVTFPADFRVKELAGQEVKYVVEVLEVREKVLPVLDEAFWKALDVESEAQLRERISSFLKGQKEQQRALRQREAIARFLKENTEMELPQSALEEEKERIAHHLIQHNLAKGVRQEALDEHRDEITAQAEKLAQEKIKMALIVDAIVEKEGLQLNDKEFNQLIVQEAMINRCRPEEIVEVLKRDHHAVNDMRQRGLTIKAIDFILRGLTGEKSCSCQEGDACSCGGECHCHEEHSHENSKENTAK